MKKYRNHLLAGLLSVIAAGLVFDGSSVTTAMAAPGTQVAVIVNGNAITNYDISRRAAFLRLQRRNGNLNKLAREELVDEMLRRIEMKKRNINVSDGEVNRAFADFAERNRMTEAQLAEMLNQAGVTAQHFKSYIRVQMGWGRLVSMRFRAEGMVSEEEAVQRMLKNGGVKPTANEYRLQQVIFVVPKNRRAAIIGKRRQEANALRSRVHGCNNLHQLTKGMLDVTIRDLGRILGPQIPAEWEKAVKATAPNRATPTINTQRGVEFLVICSVNKVSDDRVAQLVFSIQDSHAGAKKAAMLEKKYMKELRDKARIQNL